MSEHEVNENFLVSLVIALKHRMVEFPRNCYHYREVIWQAIDGDLKPLEQAVRTIGKRTKKFAKLPGANKVLSRWRDGMVRNFDTVYQTVSHWHMMLSIYWSNANAKTLTGTNRTICRHSLKLGPEKCSSGKVPVRRVKRGQVIGL